MIDVKRNILTASIANTKNFIRFFKLLLTTYFKTRYHKIYNIYKHFRWHCVCLIWYSWALTSTVLFTSVRSQCLFCFLWFSLVLSFYLVFIYLLVRRDIQLKIMCLSSHCDIFIPQRLLHVIDTNHRIDEKNQTENRTQLYCFRMINTSTLSNQCSLIFVTHIQLKNDKDSHKYAWWYTIMVSIVILICLHLEIQLKIFVANYFVKLPCLDNRLMILFRQYFFRIHYFISSYYPL